MRCQTCQNRPANAEAEVRARGAGKAARYARRPGKEGACRRRSQSRACQRGRGGGGSLASKRVAIGFFLLSCCRGGETHVQTPTDVGVPDAAIVSPLEPPALHVLLSDPRFADARAKEGAREW